MATYMKDKDERNTILRIHFRAGDSIKEIAAAFKRFGALGDGVLHYEVDVQIRYPKGYYNLTRGRSLINRASPCNHPSSRKDRLYGLLSFVFWHIQGKSSSCLPLFGPRSLCCRTLNSSVAI